jgi:hypothetical protein
VYLLLHEFKKNRRNRTLSRTSPTPKERNKLNGFHSGLKTANPLQEKKSGKLILSSICDQTLPFSSNDITAGCENELQAVVQGSRAHVDLAQMIEGSNYFQNIVKRAAAGESPRRLIARLEEFLRRDDSTVWENSWVRIPLRSLTPFTSQIFYGDLAEDKSVPDGKRRSDCDKFFVEHRGEKHLRVPVSYLLKLSLAQALSCGSAIPNDLKTVGSEFLTHFLNDNSSPETFSFYVASLTPETRMGGAIAKEMSLRYLLTQLLVQLANDAFSLKSSGQTVSVYFSPHPPVRQKLLNGLISDSFYRELFMNPCLSGWNRGEEKLRYMYLCHEVMSRSQLNAIFRLKDAGIVPGNMVMLPSTSNISLANNGTHLSIGSRMLTERLQSGSSGFGPLEEKYLGDLAIKIVEHFLPLFVGTYSAAPYRMDFWDFHPEKALGVLPHELKSIHLRMLWRRWKEKANISFFGKPITPSGYLMFDKTISLVLGLKGDFIPDFRLIDYLVALHSTDQSPALDGTMLNQERLKRDLAQLGVFDESMSLYLLYKQRAESVMGFSGFEGRHFSLFESVTHDFSEAAGLQSLLTALAYKYIANGTVTHDDIPDNPLTESERRQFLFTKAIGVRTCNVRESSPNRFLMKILANTRKSRASSRHPGYLHIHVADYLQALVQILKKDGSDLIESFNLSETITQLELRLQFPDQYAASGKLTSGILKEAGANSPLALSGEEFNLAAEKYYRESLRRKHMDEALSFINEDLIEIDRDQSRDDEYRKLATRIVGSERASRFLDSVRSGLLSDSIGQEALVKCIGLILLLVKRERERFEAPARHIPA